MSEVDPSPGDGAAALPRVDGDALEWEGQLQTWEGRPFTGVEVWRFPDGAVDSETTYRDGLADGPARTWDEHGRLLSEHTCRLGALHGRRQRWHPDGRLAEDARFEWGVRLTALEYDEQGRLTEDFTLDPADPESQYAILVRFREVYDPYLPSE